MGFICKCQVSSAPAPPFCSVAVRGLSVVACPAVRPVAALRAVFWGTTCVLLGSPGHIPVLPRTLVAGCEELGYAAGSSTRSESSETENSIFLRQREGRGGSGGAARMDGSA